MKTGSRDVSRAGNATGFQGYRRHNGHRDARNENVMAARGNPARPEVVRSSSALSQVTLFCIGVFAELAGSNRD